MTARLRAKAADGRVIIDSDTFMMAFVGKGSFQVALDANYGSIGGASGLPAFQMVAMRCAGVGIELTPWVVTSDAMVDQFYCWLGSNGYAQTVTVEYWLFRRYKLMAPGNVGLRLKNAQGEVTFDASYPPLRVVGKVPCPQLGTGSRAFVGFDYSGRDIAYLAYGTVYRELFSVPWPPPQEGDGVFAIQPNAATPMVQHQANGLTVWDGYNVATGSNWSFGAYTSGGSVYDGGYLLVDVTNY